MLVTLGGSPAGWQPCSCFGAGHYRDYKRLQEGAAGWSLCVCHQGHLLLTWATTMACACLD